MRPWRSVGASFLTGATALRPMERAALVLARYQPRQCFGLRNFNRN